jgi:hypothetical protein
MQDAFGTVIWVVCGVSAVGAVIALLMTGRTWRDFGKGGLMLDRDLPREPSAGSAAAAHERDAEIRSLLEARNARRLRRGEPPIDIEQELARLTAPLVDPELRREIRDLVVARNHRRVRAGKPPLDVEAEIEREIGRLSES